MKIGIFTDVHWSVTTSILRSKAGNYSTRLQLLINGMNWAYDLFEKEGCEMAVCAGDFFDKDVCNDEELSATREVNWKLPTVFVVGNHESSRADLFVSSTAALGKPLTVPGVIESDSNIIREPLLLNYKNIQFYFLPYVVESDRKPIKEYLPDYDKSKKHVIFSHNDLRNVQYGPYLNTTGFSVEEIEAVADLYLNGHIHNGQWITDKILDLGSMTAQNFTNDSFKYKYGIWILDTDTLEIKFYENPFSLNFYKLDIESEEDIAVLDTLKSNAIVSIRCLETLKEKLLAKLDALALLLTRITYYNIAEESGVETECVLVKSDHLEQFRKYIIENLGETNIIKEELNEICR